MPTSNRTRPGALLFSIINGKMSEGINFSDNLARCVIVVGLPYPNVHDPETREKCQWAERERTRREEAEARKVAARETEDRKESSSIMSPKTPSTPRLSAGDELLNTICMRSVNQSIGRAFRHIHDYASILLLDQRYTKPAILDLLPKWLKTDQFRPAGMEFEKALGEVSNFFQEKKQRRLNAAIEAPQHQQLSVPMQICTPTLSTASIVSADETTRKRKVLEDDMGASKLLAQPMKKPDLAGIARVYERERERWSA